MVRAGEILLDDPHDGQQGALLLPVADCERREAAEFCGVHQDHQADGFPSHVHRQLRADRHQLMARRTRRLHLQFLLHDGSVDAVR